MALVVVASKPLTWNIVSAAATMRDLVVSFLKARRPPAGGVRRGAVFRRPGVARCGMLDMMSALIYYMSTLILFKSLHGVLDMRDEPGVDPRSRAAHSEAAIILALAALLTIVPLVPLVAAAPMAVAILALTVL